MYFPNRSSLSEGSDNKKTANNRIRITLSARAGSQSFHKVLVPLNDPIPSPSPSTPSTEIYTESLPSTTVTSTSTSTTSTSSSSPLISITKTDPLPDHYYFSDHDDPIDYYDNVDEISIPSSSIKSLHNKKNHSSPSIKTSSSSLSQSTSPAQVYVRINDHQQNRIQFRLPEYTESRYDQSTLKSFFMSSPTTESITHARLRMTTTEKPTSTVIVPSTTSARDSEVQRQKIFSFIISENQPSSFKAPSPTTPKPFVVATNKDINLNSNYFKAFVNTQESTTTISHPNTTSTNSPRFQIKANESPTKSTILLSRDQLAHNKTIRLTLSSNLGALKPIKSHQSSSNQYSQGSVEEIPLIRSRQPETRQSLQLKPIEPTTYSPQKPFRTSTTETTTKLVTTTSIPTTLSTLSPTSILLEDDVDELEPFLVHSRRRPYVNDFLTNSNNIPTRFPPRSTTTTEIPVEVTEATTQASTSTTFRSVIQSFTSRGLVFKENLNRTFEPQNLKPIVSPYISLEKQRLTNAIRTTTSSPRPNDYTTKFTTSTSLPLTPSTYRSYFLITAPIKDKSSIPSTFLFPESSSLSSTSILTTISTTPEPATARPAPFSINTESSFVSTENSRGRYRPFVTFTSQNSIDEEPTTYSPRLRYNTRTQTMVDSVSSSSPPTDQPVVRRKVVRLKSAALPSNKPIEIFNPSTEFNRFDVTTSTPLSVVSEKFVASPSRETSQFKPIVSKSNDFVSKLSYSSDSPSSAALRQSPNTFNQLPKVEESRKAPAVDTVDKPFFYIRFKNSSMSLEPFETSTKKFRATVEMPEMNVPTEKELNAYVDTDNEEVYDEEENDDHQNSSGSLDIIENVYRGEHEVDYVNRNRSLPSSTVAPSTFHKIQFNTTYSTISETSTSTSLPTTSTLTSTSLRTTEKELTTTTANPKSLIPPRTSRVNNAIKTSIVAGLPRRNSASIKCNDISANAKCNEIPSRYYT